ncbi:DUF4267 domain-containing protein [Aspergillus stella-maris]|uniref:DUF4267 domain-containing protein n=1 Tax=Aspergillus stella-maris TaxID=1810926 RepID=UPI003CCDF125
MSTTSAFSPLPTYIVGTLCIALGVNAFIFPEKEYPRFGLPLEPPAPASESASASSTDSTSSITTNDIQPRGTVSPLIYIKSVREITYGLALIALQRQGQEKAVTILAGVISLAGLGDGFVVWILVADRRGTAINHWGTFFAFVGWAIWRGFSI